MERALKVIRFIENLQITSGSHAGRPFILRPWQQEIIYKIYGPTDEQGRRIAKTALISMGRKNGKTQLAAALVLVHLVGPEWEARGQIYSAASDRAQASLVFNEAAAMIRADPELDARVNIIESVKRIVDYSSGSFYQAVSSESRRAHGFSASFIVYDELAQSPNRRLWDVLTTSTGARAEPLTVVISTQSGDPNHIMTELFDYGEKVRDGAIEDPAFVPCLFSVAAADDIWNEQNWYKANPALGDFRSLDEMRQAAEMAKRIPARESAFRSFYLNQRVTAGDTRFISAVDWEACGGLVDPDSLRGAPCFGGLDLSSTQDLTCLTLYFPSRGGKLLSYFWLPGENLQKREDRDRVPYSVWAKKGFLELTPGRVIDKLSIVRKLAELSAKYDIRQIAFDRWRIEELLKLIADEGIKLPLKAFGQGFKEMSPSIDRLESLILGKQIQHGDNPVLTWHISNAAIISDPAGNRKFAKEKSRYRIDGAVSLAMAVGIEAIEPDKKPVELNFSRPWVINF